MSSTDQLRAQLRVAELEEALVKAKGGKKDVPRELKDDLRYARWVARGGPAEEPQKSTQALHDRYAEEG
jgi:hypothetical protein